MQFLLPLKPKTGVKLHGNLEAASGDRSLKIAKDKLVQESTDVTQGNWFELTIRPTGQL